MNWMLAVVLGIGALVIAILVASRSDWYQRLTADRAEKQRDKLIDSGDSTAQSTASIDDKMDDLIEAVRGDDEHQALPDELEPMSARAALEQEQAEIADHIRKIVEGKPFVIPTPAAQEGGWFKAKFWYKPDYPVAAYEVIAKPSPLMHRDMPAELGLPNGWHMENGTGRQITIRPKDLATPVPDHIYLDTEYKIEDDPTDTVYCQRISLWLGGDDPPAKFDGCHEAD